jgi:hypothetical protein
MASCPHVCNLQLKKIQIEGKNGIFSINLCHLFLHLGTLMGASGLKAVVMQPAGCPMSTEVGTFIFPRLVEIKQFESEKLVILN